MNSVQNIKNGSLSLDDRIAIKTLGRPTPDLEMEQINVSKNRTYRRNFQKAIYDKCLWLCGCNVTNKFYCFPCILAQAGKQCQACDHCWVKEGVSDLKHLTSKIKSHGISQKHLANELNISMLGKTEIHYQLSSAYRDSVKEHNRTVDSNRYILSKLVDCIKFCGAFELALCGHDKNTSTSENPGILRGLVNFMAEIDSILKAHLKDSKNKLFEGTTSKQIQDELLDSMFYVCRSVIKEEIQAAKYIAIQIDETTIALPQIQMIFIVRYVKEGQIYERFWNFITLKDHAANGLLKVILATLVELGIDKKPEKLIAQSYDGTTVMMRNVGVVQAKIKNIYKNAQYIHCYAHQLNLLIEKCCTVDKGVKVFFANLSAFPDFFSASKKRTVALERVAKKRLPHTRPTQLNFTSKCISTVYTFKEDLLICLHQMMDTEMDKDSINQTQGLINYLKDSNFNFWLFFFNKLTPHCDKLFNELQSRQLNSSNLKRNIVDFSIAVQNIRNNIEMQINQELYNNAQITSTADITAERRRAKKRKLIKHEDSLDDPVRDPLNDPLKNSFNDSLMDPLNDSLNEPLEDPLNVSLDPLNDPLADPLDDPLADPLDDRLVDPLNDPLADPLNDPLENPLNDSLADPLNDPLADTLNDPLNDPLQNPNLNIWICKEICNTLITHVTRSFNFDTYLTIANLFEAEKFSDYFILFPTENVKTVCSVFPNINFFKLKNELSVIYSRNDFKQHGGIVSLLEMFIKNNLTVVFSECIELLNILCTVPVITVESERCFSTLERIKTFLKNTMCQERLYALAMLSIERKLFETLPNFNNLVINHFAAKNSRSMDFTYKQF